MSYRRRLSLMHKQRHRVFSDLSFSVLQGETLGIVGRNGAGKSTLLRLLAGVLEPDKGKINRHHHSVSLLSLNLGLDPQLNGIDNAILSALLLGIDKKQAKNNLEKIIEFSELGQAVYDPVKTYSSGMKTRLGFSIAIHLQPSVLLIDEVLGVGDLEFRRKSSNILNNKINSSQTVVLVSHNMQQIRDLCDKVMWIENGQLKRIGATMQVLEDYEKYATKSPLRT